MQRLRLPDIPAGPVAAYSRHRFRSLGRKELPCRFPHSVHSRHCRHISDDATAVAAEAAAGGTIIEGQVTGDESIDYVVEAEAGQRLSADLSATNASLYFNILPQGLDEAIFIGSISGNVADIPIPAAGTYVVRVYLMRNAARRDEGADYALGIGLAGGDFADGLAGGADWWQVAGVTSGALKIRSGPDTRYPVVGKAQNGEVMQNRGCRLILGTRCCSIRVDGSGVQGWVAGSCLVEAAAPAAPTTPDGSPAGNGTPFDATGVSLSWGADLLASQTNEPEPQCIDVDQCGRISGRLEPQSRVVDTQAGRTGRPRMTGCKKGRYASLPTVAGTCCASASVNPHDLVTTLHQPVRYVQPQHAYGRLMTFDRLATTGDRPHSCFHRLGGMLRCVLLVLALGLLAMLVAPGAAEAHGFHTAESAADHSDEATATGDYLGVTAQCETTCCSPVTCATALVSLHDASPRFDTGNGRFSLPSDARVDGSLQTALRRPPRA